MHSEGKKDFKPYSHGISTITPGPQVIANYPPTSVFYIMADSHWISEVCVLLEIRHSILSSNRKERSLV